MTQSVILCPICSEIIESLSAKTAACVQGHTFTVQEGIIDLMPTITDENLMDESQHWDKVTKQGGNVLKQNAYMSDKIVTDYRRIYEQIISREWPDYETRDVWIGEIGCGSGSAVSYLRDTKFGSVNYIGADISMERLRAGILKKVPHKWNVKFVRTSVSVPTFNQDALDIAFSASALHHLDISKSIEWLSSSVKKGGLLMLNEPSLGNPFASIGRRMIHGFHTKGEKPLIPREVTEVSARYNLVLIYEKGLHFLTGPLHFLMGKFSPPQTVVICSYYIAKGIERVVISPHLNYSFIHVYRKI